MSNLLNMNLRQNESFQDFEKNIQQVMKPVDVILGKDLAVLHSPAELLDMLRVKHFNYSEISTLLKFCGVDLSAAEILQHLSSLDDKKHALSTRFAEYDEALRHAIRTGSGLSMHYQPQFNMVTGQMVGAEALMRWNYNGKSIAPSEFVAVAEESDLIIDLGRFALLEACTQAKRWASMGFGLKIGVNLSVKQLSPELPDYIFDMLKRTELSPELLGLEISESFFAGSDSVSILQIIRESGIELSIDDFGTGYSCLSQLNNLPIDTIKIDQHFVRDIGNTANTSVIETIIALANKLGLKTLAEGVETQRQVEELVNLGCITCQGYYFSKPLPADEFLSFCNQMS
jgi:EAL domain-containing protein (putative c-di-GMP-specific phosphodiesterase class I)